MKAIFWYDLKGYARAFSSYLGLVLMVAIGLFCGHEFNLNIGSGVQLNSPYTIGFMLGLLSLSVIFMATVFATKLLFREWDSQFDLIVFSTPIRKPQFVWARFLAFYFLTVFSFLLLVSGFCIGQHLRSREEMNSGFYASSYLYPFLLFGGINSLLVCSVLGLMAWKSKSKMLVAVGGLLLYVLYMVVLLFSNSPFMAQSTPQSLETQYIAALLDPFGLSAYFWESKDFSVAQRNTLLTPLRGALLINRLAITLLSLLLVVLAQQNFSFLKSKRRDRARPSTAVAPTFPNLQHYTTAQPSFGLKAQVQALISFLKIDLSYSFRGIPIVLTSILLLFHLGMEMYAEIEKGIRLPQKFASSGLMATTISTNFHFLGVLLVVYYVNDLYWRSSAFRFAILENTTIWVKFKLWGHWLSMGVVILFFTSLSILLALVFQVAYQYPLIEWEAYGGVFVFNCFPLVLLAGILLLLNHFVPHKYPSLGLSLLLALFLASPLVNKFIPNPLFRFLTGYNGEYSDFNGYGVFWAAFVQRLVFGGCLVMAAWGMMNAVKSWKFQWRWVMGLVCLFGTGTFFAQHYMQGYLPKDDQAILAAAAQYEKQFRKYQSIPQPTISKVKTKIQLYSSQRSYQLQGEYVIKNLSGVPIQRLLINFAPDLTIQHAHYISAQDSFSLHDPVSELNLKRALQPQDSAKLRFSLHYTWAAVNGHDPVNAIVENGSFMRISRYYPQIGYQAQREISDEKERKTFGLGMATQSKKLADPRTSVANFIDLEMEISTDHGQTVVGTGELVKQWTKDNRAYFRYQTPSPIPFRFALSSAQYQKKCIQHQGINVCVLYHPQHAENVDHLIRNARLTLDYCQRNFGPYPFSSITFAEVSAFTRGFAATAYPGSIFMPENMIFHANLKADQQQDVINELAGHELAHLWWGGNQIVPDEREGAAVLTETLAMYTEMMLYKKMYGRKKMLERVKMHQQIYDAEKGFSENEPLYKAIDGNAHIYYSKGAVIMVKISDLIGEAKVNQALQQLLQKHAYPNARPISTDLMHELLLVAEQPHQESIRKLFMEQ